LTSDIEYDDVYSVLQAFKPFLKSIDMRTIAVRNQSGEDWENFITSMVISEKSVDEVKKNKASFLKLELTKLRFSTSRYLLTIQFSKDLLKGKSEADGLQL
jgi:hypothetical protein